MRDYFTLGSTPYEEDCAQVGTEGYYERAKAECKRYIELLRKIFGNEPDGARLAIKSFPHDFGTYYEVVCWFDTGLKESVEYAEKCEDEGPGTWEG
jgi:hypothetical protein